MNRNAALFSRSIEDEKPKKEKEEQEKKQRNKEHAFLANYSTK